MTKLRRAAVRSFAALAVGLALVIGAGVTWQAIAEQDSRSHFPPPGELLELADGRLIHLRTWGTQHDGPTIILDAAASMPSSSFALLAAELAQTHRVVAYDRPGMAWSSGGHGPRDARTFGVKLVTRDAVASRPWPRKTQFLQAITTGVKIVM